MKDYSFGSDNFAPAHPDVIAAVVAANAGRVPAYGDDDVTARAVSRFRDYFGDDVAVFFVFNGTAANVLSLQALLRPHEAVICAETAHVNTDECGAPERYLGSKLLTVPTPDGKLTPDLVDTHAWGWGDQHRVQPRVVSITQATELGTVYTPDEVRALCMHAHAHGLYVHMDGARVANAAAALGLGLREATRDLGVDVLSFGGTKNGLLGGEAVVFFRPELANGFLFARKQAMQLASKMRFVAAQLDALLDGNLWLRNAESANAMAQRLAAAVADVPGVRITRPVEANAVFATLPAAATVKLRRDYEFYVWNDRTGEVRWMTAWDTSTDDVATFASALAGAVAG